MNQEFTQAPLDPEIGVSAPHLVDYWQVITRRLWLVLLIFGVTTASAIWAVSRGTTYYQTSLLVQVDDKNDRARALTASSLRLQTQIFVDPILSEIEVLRSGQVARSVVEELGLRFRPANGLARPRSHLFRNVYVAEEARNGGYELRYDPSGMSVALIDPDGFEMGRAEAGEVLDAGTIRFTAMPAPSETRTFPVDLVPADAVVGEIQGPIAGTNRDNTNLIDISFWSEDEVLAPQMLDAAAVALANIGAARIRRDAQRTVDFTRDRLDSMKVAFRESAGQQRAFQESRAFTNLDAEGQRIFSSIQAARDKINNLSRQETAFQSLRGELEGAGIGAVDLVSFLAALPQGINPQLKSLVDAIQGRKDEVQRLMTEVGMTDQHSQVRGIRTQILNRESELGTAVVENLKVVTEEIEAQELILQNLLAQQARLPEVQSRVNEMTLDIQNNREFMKFLNSNLYQAQILAASAEPYIQIVDPARPATAVRPKGRQNLFLGALLGLILGVGAAFFLEYLDRTVRTSSDVETLLGIPVLGIIPKLRRVEEESDLGHPNIPLLVAMDPLDPAAEAYRNLRMNLMFMSTEEEPIRTILFSSPGPNEGKSTSALNFAVMLAQQGQRVLLIDADLRRPSIHKALDLLREPGLTNLLVSDVETREAVRPSVLPNLDVLPSGPFPPNPSELLNSKSMERLLEEFEGRYSHIIVDSPPVLAVTDAALVGAYCDGMVLVLRSGETEQRASERSVDQLRRIGVRVFGAVLNEVSTATTEESYYLQYYYSYHPRETKTLGRLREGLSKARFW
jgi:capsular exopolysaccharide synthesis family protein